MRSSRVLVGLLRQTARCRKPLNCLPGEATLHPVVSGRSGRASRAQPAHFRNSLICYNFGISDSVLCERNEWRKYYFCRVTCTSGHQDSAREVQLLENFVRIRFGFERTSGLFDDSKSVSARVRSSISVRSSSDGCGYDLTRTSTVRCDRPRLNEHSLDKPSSKKSSGQLCPERNFCKALIHVV